jgi:beta-glucanase (GH16 family)
LPTRAFLVRCLAYGAIVAELAACAAANGAHETRPPDAAAGTDAAPDAAFEDAPDATGSDAGDGGGWTLTWSDEFDGSDGSAPDPSKWRHDTGGGGFGNKELEYYTPGTANVVVQGGNLVITATTNGAAQNHCWYGTCQYTSARIKTEGLFSQQYGRFEARMQLPAGQGLWPAFWLLGDNIGAVGWPACGEIDIMENVGKLPSEAWGSLHSKNYDATLAFTLPAMARFADGFHTFAVEWDAAQIQFLVDGQLYETHLPAQATGTGGQWPFDQPFFVLLNVAVGGNWPGSPDSTTTFPQTMLVDYVRVYRKN